MKRACVLACVRSMCVCDCVCVFASTCVFCVDERLRLCSHSHVSICIFFVVSVSVHVCMCFVWDHLVSVHGVALRSSPHTMSLQVSSRVYLCDAFLVKQNASEYVGPMIVW